MSNGEPDLAEGQVLVLAAVVGRNHEARVAPIAVQIERVQVVEIPVEGVPGYLVRGARLTSAPTVALAGQALLRADRGPASPDRRASR